QQGLSNRDIGQQGLNKSTIQQQGLSNSTNTLHPSNTTDTIYNYKLLILNTFTNPTIEEGVILYNIYKSINTTPSIKGNLIHQICTTKYIKLDMSNKVGDKGSSVEGSNETCSREGVNIKDSKDYNKDNKDSNKDNKDDNKNNMDNIKDSKNINKNNMDNNKDNISTLILTPSIYNIYIISKIRPSDISIYISDILNYLVSSLEETDNNSNTSIITGSILGSSNNSNTPLENSTISNTPLENSIVNNTPSDNSTISNTSLNNSTVNNTPYNNNTMSNTPLHTSTLNNTPYTTNTFISSILMIHFSNELTLFTVIDKVLYLLKNKKEVIRYYILKNINSSVIPIEYIYRYIKRVIILLNDTSYRISVISKDILKGVNIMTPEIRSIWYLVVKSMYSSGGLGGVSSNGGLGGVSNKGSRLEGVNISSNKQQGVNTSTYKQHPLNTTSDKQHPLNTNNNNINTLIHTLFNITYNHYWDSVSVTCLLHVLCTYEDKRVYDILKGLKYLCGYDVYISVVEGVIDMLVSRITRIGKEEVLLLESIIKDLKCNESVVGGVSDNRSMLEGVNDKSMLEKGVNTSMLESVNDNSSEIKGVNNKSSKEEGVNNLSNIQEGVNISTHEQQGVNKPTNEQQPPNNLPNNLFNVNTNNLSNNNTNNLSNNNTTNLSNVNTNTPLLTLSYKLTPLLDIHNGYNTSLLLTPILTILCKRCKYNLLNNIPLNSMLILSSNSITIEECYSVIISNISVLYKWCVSSDRRLRSIGWKGIEGVIARGNMLEGVSRDILVGDNSVSVRSEGVSNSSVRLEGVSNSSVILEGASDRSVRLKGVSNSSVRSEGVSNSSVRSEGVSNSTNKQQGLNDSTNEQQGLCDSTNTLQPFNNNTNTLHPVNTPLYNQQGVIIWLVGVTLRSDSEIKREAIEVLYRYISSNGGSNRVISNSNTMSDTISTGNTISNTNTISNVINTSNNTTISISINTLFLSALYVLRNDTHLRVRKRVNEVLFTCLDNINTFIKNNMLYVFKCLELLDCKGECVEGCVSEVVDKYEDIIWDIISSREEGVWGYRDKDSKDMLEGVNCTTSKYKGVNCTTSKYKGVNINTIKQQGVTNLTKEQQGVNINTIKQHPLNAHLSCDLLIMIIGVLLKRNRKVYEITGYCLKSTNITLIKGLYNIKECKERVLEIIYKIYSEMVGSDSIEGSTDSSDSYKGVSIEGSDKGVSNSSDNYKGVSNTIDDYKGVSIEGSHQGFINSTDNYKGVSNSNMELHPLITTTNEQPPLITTTNEQHPFNNNNYYYLFVKDILCYKGVSKELYNKYNNKGLLKYIENDSNKGTSNEGVISVSSNEGVKDTSNEGVTDTSNEGVILVSSNTPLSYTLEHIQCLMYKVLEQGNREECLDTLEIYCNNNTNNTLLNTIIKEVINSSIIEVLVTRVIVYIIEVVIKGLLIVVL
ncbi:hypothetical protein CWI37_1386p0010, partial [Hamiltosporidium tvaerminnensis]